jgi:hypothetical protein
MPTSPGRAIFTLNGTAYAIGGAALYDVTGSEPILRAQGLSDLDGSIAQILGNGDAGHQLLFRADTTLYSLDLNAPISADEPLDPPSAAPTFANNTNGGNMPSGWFGYAYTFVTATGETTASARLTTSNPGIGDPFGGTELVNGIAAGVSVVTSRNIYRTATQASEAAAGTAQLKLVGSFADNTSTQFTDTHADADLGVNVPTVNTATVHIEALTTITGITSNQIAYLNGYGLSLDRSRSEVRFSDLFDFSTWDALDVFQRSDAADKWQAMIVNHKEIWLFGLETTSVYSNVDDPDIPFQPIASAFIPVGIAAPNSACSVDGQLMWIGQGIDGQGIVYKANGWTPERISTHAVEDAFRIIGSAIADAEGSTYQENGHVFYVLTIPSVATWVYDSTSSLWHERGNYDGLQYVGLDTRGNAQIEGTQYTLSLNSGNVYHQSVAYHVGTDGEGVVRLRRAPHISKENKGIIIDGFSLKFEPGLALATGQGSDPRIAMRFSKNGGQTWSNTRTVSAGLTGEYDTRAMWTRLGYGRDRIIEITVSDPIFWPIIDAFIDARTGDA